MRGESEVMSVIIESSNVPEPQLLAEISSISVDKCIKVLFNWSVFYNCIQFFLIHLTYLLCHSIEDSDIIYRKSIISELGLTQEKQFSSALKCFNSWTWKIHTWRCLLFLQFINILIEYIVQKKISNWCNSHTMQFRGPSNFKWQSPLPDCVIIQINYFFLRLYLLLFFFVFVFFDSRDTSISSNCAGVRANVERTTSMQSYIFLC